VALLASTVARLETELLSNHSVFAEKNEKISFERKRIQ
jgi:hypothetical protein